MTDQQPQISESETVPCIPTVPQQQQQHFCLRWNNYQTNLTSVFDKLLQNESFVDVTLACQDHSIKAHKVVLSACSPYFQSLFYDNPCQHPVIIFSDVKWPELKSAVEFMYKGEINVSHEQISPLLRVAEILKIRGLTDIKNSDKDLYYENNTEFLNSKHPQTASLNTEEVNATATGTRTGTVSPSQIPSTIVADDVFVMSDREKHVLTPLPLHESNVNINNNIVDEAVTHKGRKRRRVSEDHQNSSSQSSPISNLETESDHVSIANECGEIEIKPDIDNTNGANGSETTTATAVLSSDMEIKPGIAEMIREEERAKMLESTHNWLGASTSSIAADSYQYQLQSMWQKCWNTNQSLVHNLRFRERGPLKSWRPETMAEAIFSVLKEGLSLSQAARKYDIPYPTFVLYANRVHNMLGPSADGGTDLRPKGRGRPQRILLGIWPDEHIRGVIRAVVFRDSQNLKDDPHLTYSRLQEAFTPSSSCPNPESIPATVVAAVAQGLRQQVCNMVAAAQQQVNAAAAVAGQDSNSVVNFVNSLAMAAAADNNANSSMSNTNPIVGTNLPSSLTITPTSQPSNLNSYPMSSPSDSVQDLRISSPIGSHDDHSPTLDLVGSHMLEPALNINISGNNLEMGIGMSNLPYSSKQKNRIFSSSITESQSRHENLFHDEIDDICKSSGIKETKSGISIKIEPLECRND